MALCSTLALLTLVAVGPAAVPQSEVFVSGQEGYHTYRIPALLVTPQGTVLAFCEGRKTGRGDAGDIDLLFKRSVDGGRSFSPQQVLWDDGPNTCGNPCPVVDQKTGTIWLLMTHNLGEDREHQIIDRTSKGTRTVWISKSTDDGQSWAKPVEITAAVKRPDWTWYATGPGVGIQLTSGRLVVPCDHIEAESRRYFSHVIYSDDGGATWQLGGSTGPEVNECQVIQRRDGSLLLNMRNQTRQHTYRAVATSTDAGLTWSAVSHDPGLVEPICQASLLRGSATEAGVDEVFFSNPASAEKRQQMTVRQSVDGGRSWPESRELWSGPAAYSCLGRLPDGTVLCLYERGERDAYETIVLAFLRGPWERKP